MKGVIKKADIVLGIILVIICLTTSVMVYGFGSEGSIVQIRVDGKIYGEYSLSKDQIINIDTKLGHNQVMIKDGKVKMSEADCPDGYCLHQYKGIGGIHTSNQTIVCLPHKVVISIIDGKNDEKIDAVSGNIKTSEELKNEG